MAPFVTPAATDAWAEWIAAQGPWHVFGGLTYDPKRLTVTGSPRTVPVATDVATHHLRAWLKKSSSLLKGRLEAGVVALEYQKSGWPHFHPLLRLSGGLQGNEFQLLGQAWFREHGYAKLESPRSEADVAAYASKYLVKDLAVGDVVFWPPRGPWPAHQPVLNSH